MTLELGTLADLDLSSQATSTTADAPRGVEVVDAPADSVMIDFTAKDLYTRGIRKRRSAPVTGYIGLNGSGKSFTAVRDSLPALLLGGRVLSTVALLDPHTGNPHPAYTRLESWQQLLDFRDGDLLLDEVTGIMDARDQGMPKHIRRHIAQFRRANVKVRWTGIDWDNTERRMRQLTQAVVRCRGWLPRPGGEVSLWAPNRLFVLTTFDAQTLKSSDDSALFTEEKTKRRKARVLHREYVYGPPIGNWYAGQLAFRCYNTMDSVSWVDNSCPVCGGKPVERSCRGHD